MNVFSSKFSFYILNNAFRQPTNKASKMHSIDLNKSISDKRERYFIYIFQFFIFTLFFNVRSMSHFFFFTYLLGLVITLKNSGGS